MGVSAEQFLSALESTGLVSAAETAALRDKLTDDQQAQDAGDLARQLVAAGRLTKFQATAVYQGKAEGLLLGNYLIVDKLGTGGMGQVFKALHRRMDRTVAIKVLSKKSLSSPDAVARFQREVKTVAKLSHPNIVAAHDADEAGGIHFLVMEYVAGNDLSTLVKSQGPLDPAQAVECLLQTARGLAHAHAAGIVHRDIKPGNLLLDQHGTVKILDMGLARVCAAAEAGVEQSDLTQDGQIMGTVDYMAPEQALDTRTADARSDLYSLGCTLHFLLTGRPPYGGDTLMKRLRGHQQGAVPVLTSPRGAIPVELEAVYQKLMAKKPSQRWQTAEELVQALEACKAKGATPPLPKALPVARPAASTPASDSSIGGAKSVQLPQPQSGGPKKLVAIAAAAVVALLAVGGGAYLLSMRPPAADRLVAQTDDADHHAPDPATDETDDAEPATPESAPPDAPPAEMPAEMPAETPEMPAEPTAGDDNKPADETAAPATDVAQPAAPVDPLPIEPVPTAASAEPATTPAPEPEPQIADAPPVDPRLPIPTDDQQQAALALLKEIFADEFAQAKRPDEQVALARQLLEQVDQTTGGQGGKYVMLREACDLAAEAGDDALLQQIVVQWADLYQIDELETLAQSWQLMFKRTRSAEVSRAVAEMALGRIDEAVARQQFDTARKLGEVALTAARRVSDGNLTRQVVARNRQVADERQQWDELQAALATLEQNPDDPAANRMVGRHRARGQGDWAGAFALWAKTGDESLAELAARSVEPPDDVADRVALADDWFNAAQSARPPEKDDLLGGAAYWYTQVVDHLEGLARVRVERRLNDLGGRIDVAALTQPPKPVAAAPTPPSQPPSSTRRPTATRRPPPQPAAVDIMPLLTGQQVARGAWNAPRPGALRCAANESGKTSCIKIPVPPPAEYDLRMRLTRHDTDGQGAVAVGLVAGGRQFVAVLGYRAGAGLALVDGQTSNANETNTDAAIGAGQAVEVICRIRRTGITVDLNGQTKIRFSGDVNRLSVPPGWAIPNHHGLFLGVTNSDFEFSDVRLTAPQDDG